MVNNEASTGGQRKLTIGGGEEAIKRELEGLTRSIVEHRQDNTREQKKRKRRRREEEEEEEEVPSWDVTGR